MGYISAGTGDHFGALLVSLMALWLMPVHRNQFRPWLTLQMPKSYNLLCLLKGVGGVCWLMGSRLTSYVLDPGFNFTPQVGKLVVS